MKEATTVADKGVQKCAISETKDQPDAPLSAYHRPVIIRGRYVLTTRMATDTEINGSVNPAK